MRRMIPIACLLLAACAAGGPVPDAGAPDAALHRTVWSPPAPRAVLLVLHGYGDHGASSFGDAAPFWAASGIAVHAIDLRGFGHNESRGRWAGEERLIADFVAEASALRAAHPGLPLVALGHSMGGGIVLAGLGEGADVDGAVLAAPAIAGGDFVSPFARAGLWAMTGLVPDRRWTGDGLVRFVASDNIEALRRMARDPLYIGAPSAREIDGLVRIMDRAAEAAPTVETPLLVLVGEKDQLVKPDQVVTVAARVPGLDRLVRYPEGWHLLMVDRQAPTVWADVRDWVLGIAPLDRGRPAAEIVPRPAGARR